MGCLKSRPGHSEPDQAHHHRHRKIAVTGISGKGQHHCRRRKGQYITGDMSFCGRYSLLDRKYRDFACCVIFNVINSNGVTVGQRKTAANSDDNPAITVGCVFSFVLDSATKLNRLWRKKIGCSLYLVKNNRVYFDEFSQKLVVPKRISMAMKD
jgi:hypothetical protein